VLGCGLATLDVVQTVDRLPAPDEKIVASALLVESGGPAANAASTAAALGIPAVLLSRVGGAMLGQLVAQGLRARGVELVDLGGPDDTPAVSTVLVTAATGERAVVSVNATRQGAGSLRSVPARAGLASDDAPVTPAASARVDAAAAAAITAALDGVTALLVDGHHLDLALSAARAARAVGVPVLLDGGSWKPGLEELLRLVDVAVLSAAFRVPDELARPAVDGHGRPLPACDTDAVAADDALTRVQAWGPTAVAQSHGADAVVVLRRGRRTTVPVPTVTVVDTLGAGDVLHGALLAWLGRHPGSVNGARTAPGGTPISEAVSDGADLLDGLRFAVTAASASCTAAGAHGWLTDAPLTEALRAELRTR